MDNKAIEKLTDKEILYLREMMEAIDKFKDKWAEYNREDDVWHKLNVIEAVEILLKDRQG